MGDIAIRAENIGKRYKISHAGKGMYKYKSLRDSMVDVAKFPFRKAADIISGRNDYSMQTEDFWALKDVSFEIKKGDVVGVIGRNGAGKSTLLKILSRITAPTTGKIELFGRVGSLLEVGTGFHPELTGRENIFLNGAILGMKRQEIVRKFDEIVAFAEIEKFIDTPVKHYSSGMYMRLAFSVAAHLESEILLVDEVLAVGDAKFQQKCLAKVEETRNTLGRAVIIVSHDLDILQVFCNRGILFDRGSVLFSSGIKDTVKRYLHDSFGINKKLIKTDSEQSRLGRYSDSPLHITSFEFMNEEGSMLKRNSSFSIRINFRVYRDVENVLIGWSFNCIGGARVFECRSAQEKGLFKHFSPGDYSITCSLNVLNLNVGVYQIDLGARNDICGLDHIPMAAVVNILEDRKAVEWYLSNSEGFFDVPASWTEPQKVN